MSLSSKFVITVYSVEHYSGCTYSNNCITWCTLVEGLITLRRLIEWDKYWSDQKWNFDVLIVWRMSLPRVDLQRVDTKTCNTFQSFMPLFAIELVCQWVDSGWFPGQVPKYARHCFVEFVFDCINMCAGNLNFILLFHKYVQKGYVPWDKI